MSLIKSRVGFDIPHGGHTMFIIQMSMIPMMVLRMMILRMILRTMISAPLVLSAHGSFEGCLSHRPPRVLIQAELFDNPKRASMCTEYRHAMNLLEINPPVGISITINIKGSLTHSEAPHLIGIAINTSRRMLDTPARILMRQQQTQKLRTHLQFSR